MRIQDLIIGLMIFAAIGLTIFGFTASLYSVDNLNITMDAYTQSQFDKMNQNLNTTQSETSSISSQLQSYAPGGANQTLDQNGELTAAGLATAAWKAVMQIPIVLGIFTTMIMTIGGIVHIDGNIIGFIIGAIIISVILTLIGISFYREVM